MIYLLWAFGVLVAYYAIAFCWDAIVNFDMYWDRMWEESEPRDEHEDI